MEKVKFRFGLEPGSVNEQFVNRKLSTYDTGTLTRKQRTILAVLVYINGIDKKGSDGCFFVENEKLMELCGVAKGTLITALNKLVENGFIKRIPGKGCKKASRYQVLDKKVQERSSTVNRYAYAEKMIDNQERIIALLERLCESVEKMNSSVLSTKNIENGSVKLITQPSKMYAHVSLSKQEPPEDDDDDFSAYAEDNEKVIRTTLEEYPNSTPEQIANLCMFVKGVKASERSIVNCVKKMIKTMPPQYGMASG